MIGKNSKGFVHLFLLVVIVAIGLAGIGYYGYKNGQIKINPTQKQAAVSLTPTLNPENPSNWAIYTNYFLGYSIKYPGGWEIHSVYPNDEYDDGEKVDLSNTHSISLTSPDYKLGISFKEEQNMNNRYSFEENAREWRIYYMSSTAELGNAQTEIIKEEGFKIDGRDAIKNTIPYQFEDMERPGTAIWMYIPLSGKHLLSVKYYSENSDEKELELYNEILSTFQFLNKNEASSLPNKLVTITYIGGLCPDGSTCSSTKLILRDGSSGIIDGLKGIQVNLADILELTGLVDSTDFDKVRTKKFTGICPKAYDGQEVIYVFYTSHGTERVSSCETDVEENYPLFSKLNGLIQ